MIIVILLFLTSVCSFPLGLGENQAGHAENALDDQVSPMARPPGDDKDALVAEFKKKVHQLTSTMNDHADNLDRFISVLNSMSAKNDTSINPVQMNRNRSSSSGPVSRVKRSPRGQTCTCMSNNHFDSYCLQQLLQRLSKPKTLGKYDVSQRGQPSASEMEDPAPDWEPDVEEAKTLSRAEPVDYYPVQDASEQVSQEEIDSQVLGLFGRKKKAVTQNSGFSDESLRIRSENDMLKSTLQSVADKMVEMQGEMASLKESQADCIQSKEIARKMEPPPVSFRISNVPTGSRGPWAGQLADSMAGQPAGRLSVTAPSYKIKDWTAMVLDDMGVAQQMAALGAVPGNAQRYGGQALRNPSGWSRATAMGPRTLTTVTEETPPKADRMKDVRKGIKKLLGSVQFLGPKKGVTQPNSGSSGRNERTSKVLDTDLQVADAEPASGQSPSRTLSRSEGLPADDGKGVDKLPAKLRFEQLPDDDDELMEEETRRPQSRTPEPDSSRSVGSRYAPAVGDDIDTLPRRPDFMYERDSEYQEPEAQEEQLPEPEEFYEEWPEEPEMADSWQDTQSPDADEWTDELEDEEEEQVSDRNPGQAEYDPVDQYDRDDDDDDDESDSLSEEARNRKAATLGHKETYGDQSWLLREPEQEASPETADHDYPDVVEEEERVDDDEERERDSVYPERDQVETLTSARDNVKPKKKNTYERLSLLGLTFEQESEDLKRKTGFQYPLHYTFGSPLYVIEPMLESISNSLSQLEAATRGAPYFLSMNGPNGASEPSEKVNSVNLMDKLLAAVTDNLNNATAKNGQESKEPDSEETGSREVSTLKLDPETETSSGNEASNSTDDFKADVADSSAAISASIGDGARFAAVTIINVNPSATNGSTTTNVTTSINLGGLSGSANPNATATVTTAIVQSTVDSGSTASATNAATTATVNTANINAPEIPGLSVNATDATANATEVASTVTTDVPSAANSSVSAETTNGTANATVPETNVSTPAMPGSTADETTPSPATTAAGTETVDDTDSNTTMAPTEPAPSPLVDKARNPTTQSSQSAEQATTAADDLTEQPTNSSPAPVTPNDSGQNSSSSATTPSPSTASNSSAVTLAPDTEKGTTIAPESAPVSSPPASKGQAVNKTAPAKPGPQVSIEKFHLAMDMNQLKKDDQRALATAKQVNKADGDTVAHSNADEDAHLQTALRQASQLTKPDNREPANGTSGQASAENGRKRIARVRRR